MPVKIACVLAAAAAMLAGCGGVTATSKNVLPGFTRDIRSAHHAAQILAQDQSGLGGNP